MTVTKSVCFQIRIRTVLAINVTARELNGRFMVYKIDFDGTQV